MTLIADLDQDVTCGTTDSCPIHQKVYSGRALLEYGQPLASTERVVMEVLAGARDDSHWEGLRRLLFGFEYLPVAGLSDYEDAAALYWQCRAGKTMRSLTDCVIAIVAIRAGAEVIHADRDFDTIARHTPLRIASLADSRQRRTGRPHGWVNTSSPRAGKRAGSRPVQ